MYKNENKFRSNRVNQVNCAKKTIFHRICNESDLNLDGVMYGVPLRFKINKIFIIVMWLFFLFNTSKTKLHICDKE